MNSLPKMNFVDGLALLFVIYTALTAYREGFPKEFPKLLSTCVAVFSGWGLLRWVSHLLEQVQYLPVHKLGIFAIPLLFIASWYLLKGFDHLLMLWIKKKYGKRPQWGLIAGAIRSTLLAGFIIVYISIWKVPILHHLFAEQSLIGRTLLKSVLPVYRNLASEIDLEQVTRENADRREPLPPSHSHSETRRTPQNSSHN